MDIFKKASKQKLRIKSSKGNLSVEQLWDLSLEELDELAVSLEVEKDNSGKKSFLTTTSEKDATAQLKFAIVLDILTTKYNAQQIAAKAQETKAHNQKILALIKEKQDDDLKGKSVEELESLLK